jgi:hypothetical protein
VSSDVPSDPTPPPLTPADWVQWAYLTLRRDWKHYEPSSRPVTAERLRASLQPELRRPVFVFGAPRSGTTFLGSCIGALPEMSYHFEPAAIQRAVQYVYHGAWTEREAQRFYRAAYRWLMRRHLDGDLRLADKTPRHAFILPFLHRTFPDATYVHIVRDGRDAALSHSKKPWMSDEMEGTEQYGVGGNRFGPYPRYWVEPDRRDEFRHTTDYHRCIWAWSRHVGAALEGKKALPDGRYHEVRYERLVDAPHETANRLLDALGVHAPAARDRLHARAANAHDTSVGNWRDELTAEQRQAAAAEAGGLLRRLAYADAPA